MPAIDLNNFRRVNVYPSLSEILGSGGILRKNIVKGKFESIDDYLDIQFKLLREDFVACLREGIQSYRSNITTKNIDVYQDTKIFRGKDKYNNDCFKIKIPKQDEDSKKFMNGSLLLFTKNRFDSLFMAKVTRRDINRSEITIELLSDINNRIGAYENLTMVESCAYFDPYFQVLTILQTQDSSNFPMEKYLIEVDTSSVYIPRYLLGLNHNYTVGKYSFPPQMLPRFREDRVGLNEGQFAAFIAALSQEFVVIQGPPGTGKTFLGLKIVETLVKNQCFWYRNSPILVISQKNFALDQFLEGLIPVTERMVRVGGQSKSEKLRRFNLNYEGTDIDSLTAMYSSMSLKKKRTPQDNLTKMSQALVVGMTTSLAARWKPQLESLKCPIVIVEEAAEVLEAHVVAALTKHCQHLILLGDHQQLQPMTADHTVGTKYLLGISLFERMIKNGIQCYQLKVQHRMRPEISNLLKVKIYPFLRDHESVLMRPDMAGVDENVFFLDHGHPEGTVNVTSKKNTHEAEFMVAFAKHLKLNGYKSDKVTILATYSGQVQEMEQVARKKGLQDVKIMTLDAFQGRESDVILLSTVRSEAVGFMGAQNRICVALSRAKNGFYVMGNMELLAKCNNWYQVKKCLERQNCIGTHLQLRCQVHPHKITRVQSAQDFSNVPHGGCNLPCNNILKCGHSCSLSCHTKYKDHECRKRCELKIVTVSPKKNINLPEVRENPFYRPSYNNLHYYNSQPRYSYDNYNWSINSGSNSNKSFFQKYCIIL